MEILMCSINVCLCNDPLGIMCILIDRCWISHLSFAEELVLVCAMKLGSEGALQAALQAHGILHRDIHPGFFGFYPLDGHWKSFDFSYRNPSPGYPSGSGGWLLLHQPVLELVTFRRNRIGMCDATERRRVFTDSSSPRNPSPRYPSG